MAVATRTHRMIAGDAHRVTGGVQGLRADHDRVALEPVFVRVPSSVGDPTEQAEDVQRVDSTAPGHRVLPVGREDHVVGTQRPGGADLGGFLAAQAGPQAKLTLALESGRLLVEAARDHHVA